MTGDFLSRSAAAEYLTKRLGRRVTVGALARHGSDGTGPRYVMILGRASYPPADLDAWVSSLIEAPRKRARTSSTRQATTNDAAAGPAAAP